MAVYHQLNFPSTFIEYRTVSAIFDILEAAPSNIPP